MNKQRILILVLAILSIIGVFLPWVKIADQTISGSSTENGVIMLFLFAISVIVPLTGNLREFLKGFKLYFASIPSVLASFLGVYKVIDARHQFGENIFSFLGIGLYIVCITGFLILIVALLLRKPLVNNNQMITDQSIKNLKHPIQTSNQQESQTCPNCKIQYSLAAKFCPDCGTPASKDKFCGECGTKVESNVKFCPNCGNTIGSATQNTPKVNTMEDDL